jgi:hypothetical protein
MGPSSEIRQSRKKTYLSPQGYVRFQIERGWSVRQPRSRNAWTLVTQHREHICKGRGRIPSSRHSEARCTQECSRLKSETGEFMFRGKSNSQDKLGKLTHTLRFWEFAPARAY